MHLDIVPPFSRMIQCSSEMRGQTTSFYLLIYLQALCMWIVETAFHSRKHEVGDDGRQQTGKRYRSQNQSDNV